MEPDRMRLQAAEYEEMLDDYEASQSPPRLDGVELPDEDTDAMLGADVWWDSRYWTVYDVEGDWLYLRDYYGNSERVTVERGRVTSW